MKKCIVFTAEKRFLTIAHSAFTVEKPQQVHLNLHQMLHQMRNRKPPVQDIPASPASSVTSKTPTTSPVFHSSQQSPTASSVPPAAPQTPKAPTAPPAFSCIQPVTYYKDTRNISAICLIGFIFSVISFVAGVILLTMALCGSSGVLVGLYYVLPALAGLALSIFGLLRTPATERGKALAIVGIVLSAVILAYFYIAIFVSVGMTL